MQERNAGLVRRAVEDIWNQGDLALADVLFAPTYVNHGGLIPDLVRGPEAIKSAIVLYRTAFPTFQITVEDLVAEQAMVLLQWTARRGPRPGPARAMPASQGEVLRGTTRSRCTAGQIAESWTAWDQAGVLDTLRRAAPASGPYGQRGDASDAAPTG